MSRSLLRTALFVVCGVLFAGAGMLAAAGCTLGVILRLAIPGFILLFGLVVERWRYKSGRLVTVFYQPSTGERRYVAAER